MKSTYFLGKGKFETREEAIPHAEKGFVVIKNSFCGVCGTDVHIYHGDPGSADVNPPVILGHEYSGVVLEVGEGVGVIKIGDHVTIDPNIYCGVCEYCRNGKKQMCEKMEAIGVTMDGGFAEYSHVPASQVYVIDSAVPLEAAAMAEPIACCIHGIDLAQIKVGDVVCIVGGGAIGLIMVQLAKLAGASRVIVSEPNEIRRDVALSLGADLAVNPLDSGAIESIADVVIECAGNNHAVKNAIEFVKKGGTVLLFSVPKVDAQYPLPLFEVYKKELTIKGSFVNPDTHQRAVDLLNSGKLDMLSIITYKFPIEMLEEAIKMQMDSESIKVLVGETNL